MGPPSLVCLVQILACSRKNFSHFYVLFPRAASSPTPPIVIDSHEDSAKHALFFVFIVLVCLYCDFHIKKRQIFMFPESAASMVVGFVLGARFGLNSSASLRNL